MMRKVKRGRFWLFILLFNTFVLNTTFAQFSNIRLKQISIEQGLPGVTIQTMMQDSKGILWFGIESVGLCKFDGHDFTVFNNIPGDTTSISNNFTSALCEDEEGYIWVGTRSGLNRFDRNSGRFTRFMHIPDNPNSIIHDQLYSLLVDTKGSIWIATETGLDRYDAENNTFVHYLHNLDSTATGTRVTALMLDKLGNIWAGTRNFGLYKIMPYVNSNVLDSNIPDDYSIDLINYKHDPDDPRSLRHDEIRGLTQAQPGKIWVGTIIGLDLLDINTGTFEHIAFKKEGKIYLRHAIFNALCTDRQGNLWAGTANNGLVILTPATNFFEYLHVNPFVPQGIKSNSIRSIIIDNSGLIWIGTKFAGLQIYDSRQETFPIIQKSISNGQGLSDNFVLSIFQDSYGVFWFGTKAGGLNKYNKKTGEFLYYMVDPGNPKAIRSNRIEKIVESKDKNIWLATENGLAYFDIKREKFHYYVNMHISTIMLDSRGTLWVGTYDGLYYLNQKTKKLEQYPSQHEIFSDPTTYITKLYEDRFNKIWICSYHDGIFEYNPEKDEIRHFYHDENDSNSISGDMIRSVYEDRSGRIWIGVISDGLNMYDRLRDRFISIKTDQGLPSNTVYSIVEDKKGNLWLGTHNGISKFDPDNMSFENYNIDYGLQGKVFEINAFLSASDGEIYLGGSQGVNHFYPDNIKKQYYHAPMIISSLRVYDKSILRDMTDYTEVALNYNDNYIFIDFSLLDYSDPVKNEYEYMLEGLDDNWINSGNRHFTSYTSLAPGEYIFKARGANLDKVWNDDGISIKLIIPKPFWKRWWFILLMVLVIISFIVLIYFLRVRSIHKQQVLLQNQVKQRTKDLQEAFTILEQQKIEIEKRNLELTKQSEQIGNQNIELEKHRNRLEQLVQERTKDLETAKEKAEESDRLKSAFLANMSHEIRTPLNAIVGFTDILASEKLPSHDVKRYNKIVQTNSVSLMQLIDDIIDISKIEAGQIEIKNREFNLTSYLTSIYEIYNEYITRFNKEKDRNVKLVYKPNKKNKNVALFADPARLKQVMDNIISNAIKFTKKGSIEIGFEFNADSYTAILFVRDTGIGIEKENYKIIFDRFRKLENLSNELYRGTGIGLSITKNLIDMMKGQIWVESVVGKGSTFYFELPAREQVSDSKITPKSAEKLKVDKPDWSGKSILIVEDEESNYEVLNSILKQTNAQIVWAKDGEEGISKFNDKKENIDLVLLDIELPKMRGTEVIKHLKKVRKNVPVIAQTAYAMQNEESEIMKTGFDDYMAKPFLAQKIYSVLSKYL